MRSQGTSGHSFSLDVWSMVQDRVPDAPKTLRRNGEVHVIFNRRGAVVGHA